MLSMSEKIVAAACKRWNLIFSLPRPARHHNVLWAMDADGYDPDEMAQAEQGFTTSEGRFVGREEALLLAIENGQVPPDVAKNRSKQLFSEDLW